VNKFRTSQRLSGLLAFALSGLFYIVVVALVLFWIKNRPVERSSFNPAPLNLSFAQIELQAAKPPPDLSRRNEVKPALVPPDAAEVAIEPKPEEPQPEPEPVRVEAQVTQAASAPAIQPVSRNQLLDWVRAQIEKEKYYPQAARNAGYEGQFRLLVKIGADGKISEAVVVDGKGNPLLRRSLEKIMAGLKGRDFGQTLESPVELPFEFEFKLN